MYSIVFIKLSFHGVTFPGSMLQTVGEWLWWERLWLPGNVSWSDLEDSEGRVYAKASHLYAVLPCAFCLLLVRYLFERWAYTVQWSERTSLCVSVVMLSSGCKRPGLCCTSCFEAMWRKSKRTRPLVFRGKKQTFAVPDDTQLHVLTHILCHVHHVLQVPGFTMCWCLGDQEQGASDSRTKLHPRKVLL